MIDVSYCRESYLRKYEVDLCRNFRCLCNPVQHEPGALPGELARNDQPFQHPAR